MRQRLLLGLLFVSCIAGATDGDFAFHGTLVSPPDCVISNQQTIEVNFGDVMAEDVDGQNYAQQVPYTIDCDPNAQFQGITMTLTLLGSAADYEGAALATNNNDLAIKVLQNDKLFTINSTLIIDQQSKPTLTVVPIKRPGTTLEEGDFESWATLQLDYQ